jgi:type III secretion system low calcium response chaperone LcrH/SycD
MSQDNATVPTDEQILQAIQDVMKGKPVYEVAGWTTEQINAVYTNAYHLYKAGSYEEAMKIFRPLLVMDSTDNRIWMGFAACAQMLRQFDEALKGYGYASLLDPENPKPFFHAMECHIALKNYAEAKVAGDYVVGVAAGKPEHEKMLARTKLLLKAIEARLS